MTVFETAILAVVLGIVLFVVAGGVGAMRQQAKRNLCARLMTHLSEALAAYYRSTGTYPPGSPDASAGGAIAALCRVEGSAAALRGLPASLRVGTEPIVGCLDPWRRALRYLTADAPGERERQEVAVNGGVPIFESAGRDGEFSDRGPAGATDNFRTSDLR